MSGDGSGLNRRRFIGGVAGAAAAGGVLAGLPAGMAQALTEPRKSGSIDDVEHVVVLMQENRSFDHYYGSMNGVRGFADRAPLRLPNGKSVLYQPDSSRSDGGYLLPFHVDTSTVDGQDLGDLDHSWGPTHAAWDAGRYDAWIANKSEMTMGYFTQSDLQFQRALADAFTICDNYFCSIQGPTTPNRLFHWTGTIDPNGTAGGPAISNPADYQPVYSWTTYPERLQSAGISWQVYANKEVGDGGGVDGWVGDYGDNPLWLFHAYHDALASPDPKVRQLADRANVISSWLPNSGKGMDVNHVLADFLAACKKGTLPSVSWIVAPYRWCEHPEARPVDGAVYLQTVLEALWHNEKLWNSTALFVNFDENDGFFDHVVPPTAPPGTADEYVQGLPIGLGPRVPMTVISPWSRGGWVNSQVFDHTSVLRFLEVWTGVKEPNISAWRRAICGDLTSCFDFGRRNVSIPALPDAKKLQAIADQTQSKLPKPTPPPSGKQVVPTQQSGSRPARPIPYQLAANASVHASTVTLALANSGTAAAQFGVYPAGGTPSQHDVAGGAHGSAIVPFVGGYDVEVHGPNGFLRRFAGKAGGASGGVEITVIVRKTVGGKGNPSLRVSIGNAGSASATVTVTNAGKPSTYHVAPGKTVVYDIDIVDRAAGWYDLTATVAGDSAYLRRFAGHVEYGDSITG